VKDEALSPVAFRMEELPIAELAPSIRAAAETVVRRPIEITSRQQQTRRTLLDWLRVEYAIEKPSNAAKEEGRRKNAGALGEVVRNPGCKSPRSGGQSLWSSERK